MKTTRYATWLILLTIAILLPTDGLTNQRVWMYEIIALLSLVLFINKSEDIQDLKTVTLNPVYLFLFAFYIVFYQRPIDYILGFIDGWYYVGKTSLMLLSLKYSTIGIICFYIGYSYQAGKRHFPQPRKEYRAVVVSPKFYTLISSLLLLGIFILVPKSVLMGGYGQQMLSEAGTFNYLSSWCSSFIIAFLVQFSLNEKKGGETQEITIKLFLKKIGMWQNINVLLYALIILNVGDRGPLIVVGLAYYISYVIVCKTKMSKKVIASALVIGILGSMYLGFTKQFRDNNSFFDRVEAVLDNREYIGYISFFAPTFELSGSYNCLPFSIEMIEQGNDYGYGTLQVAGFLSTIPFVNRFLHLPASSSYQISHFVQGDEITYGNGTNCIADLYLDGGLLLIIIGMLLCGRIFRWFEVSLFTDNYHSLFVFCMAFFFLSHVVYIPRSTILSPLKYALWIYVIMRMYNRFINVKQ